MWLNKLDSLLANHLHETTKADPFAQRHWIYAMCARASSGGSTSNFLFSASTISTSLPFRPSELRYQRGLYQTAAALIQRVGGLPGYTLTTSRGKVHG